MAVRVAARGARCVVARVRLEGLWLGAECGERMLRMSLGIPVVVSDELRNLPSSKLYSSERNPETPLGDVPNVRAQMHLAEEEECVG